MDGPPIVITDDSVDDAAKCHLCWSNLLAPKPIVLPCGHSVCEECIPSLMSMENRVEKCPFCQQIVNLGEGRRCEEYERLYKMAKEVENRERTNSEMNVKLQEEIKVLKRKLQYQAAAYRAGAMLTENTENAAASVGDNVTESTMTQIKQREEIMRKEERLRCESEAAIRFNVLEREMTCRANYEKQLKEMESNNRRRIQGYGDRLTVKYETTIMDLKRQNQIRLEEIKAEHAVQLDLIRQQAATVRKTVNGGNAGDAAIVAQGGEAEIGGEGDNEDGYGGNDGYYGDEGENAAFGGDNGNAVSVLDRKRCWNCGSWTHIKMDCPKKHLGPKCDNCHRFGHIRINCGYPVRCNACGGEGHYAESVNCPYNQ